jgi:hypothetical protein
MGINLNLLPSSRPRLLMNSRAIEDFTAQNSHRKSKSRKLAFFKINEIYALLFAASRAAMSVWSFRSAAACAVTPPGDPPFGSDGREI